MEFWKTLKVGYDIFETRHSEPKVSACNGKYVFNATFKGGEPTNPLAACPEREDQVDPALAAKAAADEKKLAELSQKTLTPLAYVDGGMHPSFRALLKENGDVKLSEKVSDIKYPISRPSAALADPFVGKE